MILSTQTDEDILGPAVVSTPTAGIDLGRRDRKKNATRRALRNAALTLVAERGLAHVTIEDITEAVDIAPRTFFNYFPSKESAVIGADPERIEQMRSSLIERPQSETALEALRAVLVEYAIKSAEEFDDLGEKREAWFRRLCVLREDRDLRGAYVAHIAEVERGLVEALAERLGRDPANDPYPALVAATAFAAARVAAKYWSANGGEGSLADLTGAAIDNLASGLADDAVFANAPLRTGGSTKSAGSPSHEATNEVSQKS
jgi:AcrR family transcriptional regulator